MPIDFPNSPTNGDTYSAGGKNWQYNGSAWVLQGVVPSIPNGSITEIQIADSAITSAKIAAGAVVEADIANDAVTAAKIASNAVTAGKLGTDVQLGYRNVVINGAMQVAQRGTSVASITTTGYRTADRWNAVVETIGTWTNSVENDAPTGSGLRKSLKWLCTTADASPAAADKIRVETLLEGQNLQQFLKGTASAKPFTLTFWVKSNVTGTYAVGLIDVDNTRLASANYTISASATWEKKTVTFPADTTGAFDNDNALSLRVYWYLASGTDNTSGTLNAVWGANTAANQAVGQTNVAAATNNYWQITGVQLEAGSVATPFEFEDYGTTLAKCQRYYFEGTLTKMLCHCRDTNLWFANPFMPVPMRGTPTLLSNYAAVRGGVHSANGDVSIYSNGWIGAAGSVGYAVDGATPEQVAFFVTGFAGTAGAAGVLLTDANGFFTYWRFSAEL